MEALILFTAQPRVAPCNLIQEAALRSIPVIAIEEVYQMMLSQGAMNNYFLPVDRFLVASEYEKEEFVKIGIPQGTIRTVGGVFRYREPHANAASKKELGLRNDKKTATLSLDVLALGGETLEIRRKLLECLSKGLPEEYQLFIKPHPSEDDKNFENTPYTTH